jgi:hypothetical protein
MNPVTNANINMSMNSNEMIEPGALVVYAYDPVYEHLALRDVIGDGAHSDNLVHVQRAAPASACSITFLLLMAP